MSRFYLWSRSAAAILAGAILGWILLQGLQLIVAWLPVAPIRAHLVLSVSNGSLLPTNYTWGDRQRGNEQFTDMAMLIPFITDRRGWRERALGPQMFVRKGSDSYNPAPDLVELLKTDMPGDISNPQARVDRYWYGPRLPMGILLQWMDLGSARRLLVVLEFLSVIAMLLVARRHRGNLFLVVAWLGIFGLLVGPIQFYGPSFAFGSPFLCANIFNIALLLYGRRTSRWPVEIELGCLAVAGAFAVYFDVLSGTVWFCLSYALICIPWLLRAWGIEGWKSIWSTGAALTAIGAGVVIPVFFKQVMSLVFLGGTPF